MTGGSWLRAAALAAMWIATGAARAERVTPQGLWTEAAGEYRTGQAGSSVRFDLAGSATLHLRCTRPQSLRVRLTVGDAVLHDGPWTGATFRVATTAGSARVTATLIANRDAVFPGSADPQPFGELIFAGVDAESGSTIAAPAVETVVDFLGDSITVGHSIHGRSGDTNSDASLAFGYLVGLTPGIHARIRGYPGARIATLSRLYPFAAPGVPLPLRPAPRWVVVNGGANDRDLSARQYRQALDELVATIRATHPDARIVLLNFFRMTPNRLPILREIAAGARDSRILAFDARPHLVDYSDGRTHPGPESHRRLGVALAAFLRDNSAP